MTRRAFTLSLAATALRGATGGGREIIEKSIQAIGGSAFRNMRTRTETGRAYTFYHNRLSSMLPARFQTRYANNSNEKIHQVQLQFFGKKQDDSVLYTDSGAWEITFRGARPLPEDKAEQYRETTLHDIYYILHQRINEAGMEFEARGKDVAENQTVETIDIYDSENRSVTVWLNAYSFLPVKQRFYHWDPIVNERREDVARYSKFLKTSGVMWPHTTERERDGEKNFQFDSDKVTINEPTIDGIFDLPSNSKILK